MAALTICVTCQEPFEQHALGRPRIYCDADCSPSMKHRRTHYLRDYYAKRRVLTQAVVGRMGTRTAGLTPRQLAHALLTACPQCGVLGPRRLLEAHLREDHG